jgi:excisionase family DNA binding protein
MTDDDLMSIDEAAQESGYSREALFKWIRAGRLSPHKRPGDRRTLVKRAELLRAVATAPRRPRSASADDPPG